MKQISRTKVSITVLDRYPNILHNVRENVGYLAAVVNKKGDDASDLVTRMLRVSSNCQGTSHGYASHYQIEFFRDEPEFTSIISSRIIGYKANQFEYPGQLLQQGSQSLLMEGNIWNTEEPDILFLANTMEKHPRKSLETIITGNTGNYAIVHLDNDCLLCARDPVGATPLYFAENEEVIAVASNKKMLWVTGLTPQSIPPGTITRIKDEANIIKIQEIKNPKVTRDTETTILDKLDTLMRTSAERMSRDLGDSMIAFSGGIDSTLIAYYLKEIGLNVQLHCVGVGNTLEHRRARQSAESLSLPISIISYTEEQVENSINPLLHSLEEANPMKLGVAMPLYWTAQRAYEQGIKAVFSGHGIDELFGGYKKYQKEYQKAKAMVKDTMYLDVRDSWLNNLERDTKTCNDQSIQLRLPFTEINFIKYGLSIPVTQKLSEERRKIVLRKLALRLGLPEETAMAPKKAAQYSTGVNKTLKKIAKRNKTSLKDYLKHKFTEMKMHG